METSLYQIRIEHLELLQEIENSEGELTPEIERALSLTQEQFQEKAISYGYVVKKFEDNITLIEHEINRLTELKYYAEKKKELFKERLSEAMQQFGVEKISNPLLTLSLRKSESVEITDEKIIPADYITEKTTYSPNKTEIKKAFKEGLNVPGARIIEKKNLQIK